MVVTTFKITELPCRLCRRSGSTERHHLVTRQSKLDVDHRTIPLCTDCHDAVHGERGVNERIIARRGLRRRLTAEEIEFVVRVAGVNYLRRHYPSRPVYVSQRELAVA